MDREIPSPQTLRHLIRQESRLTGEGDEFAPYNTMLYLAWYYIQRHPEDSDVLQLFEEWRAHQISTPELSKKGMRRLTIEHKAREEAAKTKREKSSPQRQEWQRQADALKKRHPDWPKSEAARHIAKGAKAKADTISRKIKW